MSVPNLDRVMRGFFPQFLPSIGRVLGLNKQLVSKQQYNFFCTKRTKNTKGDSTRTGLCLRLLGAPLMVPGPSLGPSSFLLVLLGGGDRAVGHKVAVALAPAK